MTTATATRERPILFSAEMVRAILDGRKTQTRRVVKPQPEVRVVGGFDYFVLPDGGCNARAFADRCPHGVPGDRLWVKEFIRYSQEHDNFYYEADGKGLGAEAWHRLKDRNYSALFCPRDASRLTLEITSVRVERVQDISEADAYAEGIRYPDGPAGAIVPTPVGPMVFRDDPRRVFPLVWDRINGKSHPWASNPWVWVLAFRHVDAA